MNFIWYLLGNGIAKFIPLLMLPIITNAVSVEEFGQLILIYSIFQLVALSVGFNSNSLVTMYYYATGSFSRGKVVPYSIVIIIVNFLIITIALLVLNIFFDFEAYYYVMPLAGVLLAIHNLHQGLLHIEQKAIKFSFISIIYGLSVFVFTIHFLNHSYTLNVSWSRFLGELCAVGLVVSLSVHGLIYRKLLNISHISLMKLLFTYRKLFPLYIHALSVFAIYYADRFILSFTVGDSAIGIYSASFMMSQALLLLIDSKSRTWTPFVAQNIKVKEKRYFYKLSLIYIFILILISVLYKYILDLAVPHFLKSEYVDSLKIISPVLIGFIFEAVYREYHVWLFLNKKTKEIATATLIAGGSHLVLCYFLTLNIGVLGASIAFAISSFLKLIIVVYYNYQNKKLVK
jgi:O-antigen/teichoic acid export membrane protein